MQKDSINNLKSKREHISKRLRFKIFERDQFKCVYCGSGIEMGITLHIDHIIPVAEGGTSEEANLATACDQCNLGKGAKIIGADKIPNIKEVNKELRKEFELNKERTEQLKQYYRYKEKLQNIKNPEQDALNDILKRRLGYSLTSVEFKQFKRLHDKCGLDLVIEGIGIVADKNRDWASSDQKHRYLCGVLYNLFREKTDPLYNPEREVKYYYLNHRNNSGSVYYVDWKIKPYIQKLELPKLKELIDDTFSEGRDGYFRYFIEQCKNTFSLIEEEKKAREFYLTHPSKIQNDIYDSDKMRYFIEILGLDCVLELTEHALKNYENPEGKNHIQINHDGKPFNYLIEMCEAFKWDQTEKKNGRVGIPF